MRGHTLCRPHRVPELGPTGGAPKGNRNAFKHGFYSRAFTRQELQEMSQIMKDEGLSLTHEIAILKLLTRRVLLSEIQPAVAYALVCRGIGQLTRSLRALDEWRGARLAIWGSALAFGLYHVGGQGPLVGLGGFIIGVIFGAIRWRAGGIVGLILVHGLVDITAMEMLPSMSIQEIGRPQVVHPILVILGYVLIVAIPLYLWRLHPSIERMRIRESSDKNRSIRM
jgi:hypothetical protein